MPPILHELRTRKTPPTFYRVNKFSEAFQALMDSYGISAYQEVNPGLFAIITFPFLFAVMFGDIGHGMIILLAGAFMIIRERSLGKANLGEVNTCFLTSIHVLISPPACCPFLLVRFLRFLLDECLIACKSGRYIILFMGIFSIYTGFLYNDVFSKSLHLWHSSWKWPEGNGTVTAILTDSRYPFGLDPGWHGADNALVFTNSYKMKMSVVLGVIHVRTPYVQVIIVDVKFYFR